MITIALPKGRLMEETIEVFSKASINVEIPTSRRLYFYDSSSNYRFLIVRAQDVPTYVERNAADLGVVGRDVLNENASDLFELVDLSIGYCRMVVAAKDTECFKKNSTIRVATKFVNIAKRFFAQKRLNAEIIKLYGSIELAPLLGIADCIVDIVSTGRTLKENGLKVVEEIFESTAVLVSNRVAFYTKNEEISQFIELLK
ncbi:ATP phosphoribosyltransferase [Hippea jasoniae]|uniref:ATP phosphoribosyltransferase n=1 Tax=Hippea jasoniae TaxID=944479 RepID=UPI00055180AD|nr:ATP phosphoribosyltransferase [Hippea jasoniae]